MSVKREYSILPQGEKDDFHHHIREGRSGVTSQYICLFTVITVTIVLIFAGLATLTASMFYSDQISTSFGHFWYSVESSISNDTSSTAASGDSSFSGGSSWLLGGSRDTTASVPRRNSTDYEDQKHKRTGSQRHHHSHRHHYQNRHQSDRNSTGDSLEEGNNSSENDWHNRNDSSLVNGTLDSSEETNSTMEGTDGDQVIEEVKVKVAEVMRDWFQEMQNFTGIRQAELLIPLFMLVCFLTLFSAFSLCCCIMMRRRDNRRRKLFGKLITDLQTGDSKTVLLNHSDLDD